ncbi:MAG: ABC transporter substrate-binding protein [Deltaproteobacteria bacterium]|nr:ABC transporter substrate-binding protein [Deltaproteobacteria bacterium]
MGRKERIVAATWTFFLFFNITGSILPHRALGAEQGPIKIGWTGGLTGALAQVVQDARQGTAAALEEINAAGGISGRQVEIIYADTKIDPQLARQAVQRLIYSDRVVAVIGDYFSPNTVAAMDIAQENKIPMISLASGLTSITRKQNAFVSRVVSSTEDMTRVLADYAVKSLHFRRFVVLTSSDAFARDAGDTFAEFVKKIGGQMVGYEIYDRVTTRDFTNLLLKYKEAPPDAFFLGGAQADSALIAKQTRELGIPTQLLGSFPVSKPPYYKIGGAVTQGTITVANYIGRAANLDKYGESSTKAFVKKWKAKFGDLPSDDHAYGYDTMKILALALERAGTTDGSSVQKAILSIRNYQGAVGTIHMVPNGDAIIPLYILRWQADGNLSVLQKDVSGKQP